MIELIKERRVLWDTSFPQYFVKQTEDKISAWQEIGGELNLTPTKVANCFTKMRDYYRRQVSNFNKSGNEPKWEYFKPMDFLRPVTKFRTPIKLTDDSTFYVEPNAHVPYVASTSNKRKLDYVDGNPINEEHKKVRIESVTILKNNELNCPLANPTYPSPPQKPMSSFDNFNQTELPTKRVLNFDGMSPTQIDEAEEEEAEIPLSWNFNGKIQFYNAFGAAVAAKLSSLKEIDANSLMNDIFVMLLSNN